MMQPLSPEIISIFFFLKNPVGVFAIIVGTCLYLNRIRLSNLWLLSFIFCIYVFLNLNFRGFEINNLFAPSMYLIWFWALFVLAPAAFNNLDSIQSYLRISIWVTICIVAIGLTWSILIGIPLGEITGGNREGAYRYFFGFRHSGYFSTIAASVLLGSLLLHRLSISLNEKKIMLGIIIIFSLLLFLANSRSCNILVLTAFLIDWTLRRGRSRRKILIIFLWFLFSVFIIYSVMQISFQDDPVAYLNYGSSGRVGIWIQALDKYLDSFWAIIAGKGIIEPLWQSGIRGFKGGYVIEAPFTVFRIDSTYLEILLLYGVIGLILFASILIRIISLSLRSIRACIIIKHHRLMTLSFGIICGIMIMAIPTSIIPSLANLINVILLLASMSILQLNIKNEQL